MVDQDQLPTEIPETYINQVKEALENLYDFAKLQHSPLARALEDRAPPSTITGAHRLRQKLIEAIEALNPGQRVVAHSGAMRIYSLVYLHHVGGMSLQECALEVGISLRQVYRDLRRGQERVSTILWYSHDHKEPPQQIAEPGQLSSIKMEITRLEGGMMTVPLQKMLDTAIRAVQKLADQHDIILEIQPPYDHVLMTTNSAIAQQVLIHLLSQVIQQISPVSLRVSYNEQGGSIHVILAYPTQKSFMTKPNIELIIEQMMQEIGWKLQYRTVGNEQHMIIRSAQEGALLLIIDDNLGLVELLDRYFTGHTYRVVSVANGEDGLRMVHQLMPDAIILDLMMPGMDGWEVLQRLRTNHETLNIPVIICSVISDPELAYSLGASKFVPKPVIKETLLSVLRELRI